MRLLEVVRVTRLINMGNTEQAALQINELTDDERVFIREQFELVGRDGNLPRNLYFNYQEQRWI